MCFPSVPLALCESLQPSGCFWEKYSYRYRLLLWIICGYTPCKDWFAKKISIASRTNSCANHIIVHRETGNTLWNGSFINTLLFIKLNGPYHSRFPKLNYSKWDGSFSHCFHVVMQAVRFWFAPPLGISSSVRSVTPRCAEGWGSSQLQFQLHMVLTSENRKILSCQLWARGFHIRCGNPPLSYSCCGFSLRNLERKTACGVCGAAEPVLSSAGTFVPSFSNWHTLVPLVNDAVAALPVRSCSENKELTLPSEILVHSGKQADKTSLLS